MCCSSRIIGLRRSLPLTWPTQARPAGRSRLIWTDLDAKLASYPRLQCPGRVHPRPGRAPSNPQCVPVGDAGKRGGRHPGHLSGRPAGGKCRRSARLRASSFSQGRAWRTPLPPTTLASTPSCLKGTRARTSSSAAGPSGSCGPPSAWPRSPICSTSTAHCWSRECPMRSFPPRYGEFPSRSPARPARPAWRSYHVSHGQWETAAPIRTFVPYQGGASILASYTCTPLVHFPLADLQPGSHATGRTVAELGAGNQPLDIVAYTPRRERAPAHLAQPPSLDEGRLP